MNSSARVHTSFTGVCAAAREPRGFDRRFAGVLAAVAGARVGDDHADALLGDAERVGQLACARPNGRCVPVQTVSLPSLHSATAARGSSGTCAM